MNKPNYRIKVENKLKRNLSAEEVVHHKDGNNYNDSIDNLQVLLRQVHNNLLKRNKKIQEKCYSQALKDLDTIIIKDFKTALNCIFTSYQISIIFRKLQSQALSKTDREVFSRIIKKKLIALANTKLFEIAQTLVS